MMSTELLRSDGLRIERREVSRPVALFSIDVETDYGTGRTEALDRIDEFADVMAELDVPWTAFVEGQFFEHRRALCRGLDRRGVDVQLHVHDHATTGDTPDSLRRSAEAFADCLGRRPAGYRAHTYRLTRPLYDALRSEAFRWDSSLMRAFAQGGNRDPGLAGGDYLVFDGDFVEVPIGTWKGTPVPLNHTHLLLAKTPGERLLRALFGPARMVAYNFHMTDLVRSGSLAHAKRRPAVRLLHRYLWSLQGNNTFGVVRQFVAYLRRAGYAFRTTDDFSRSDAAPATARASVP